MTFIIPLNTKNDIKNVCKDILKISLFVIL